MGKPYQIKLNTGEQVRLEPDDGGSLLAGDELRVTTAERMRVVIESVVTPDPVPEPEPEPEPATYKFVVAASPGGAMVDLTNAPTEVYVTVENSDWDILPRDDSQSAPGVSSVTFYLDGIVHNTETKYPYGMSGTSNGEANPTTLTTGDHVIGYEVSADGGTFNGEVSLTVTSSEPAPAPEPEPEPTPPSGDWTLVHEFSPALDQPIPDGVDIKIKDGSWVPGGKAERTADGYLMTYLVGMEDGRGPGRIGIESGAVPQGYRNMMCEYDITISSDFEDHPVYNKIAHYRTRQPAREFDTIRHGAKFIDKFKNYLIGYAGDSGTASVKAKFDPDADIRTLYPDDFAGYNAVNGNHRRDRMVGGQMHTVRVEWTWVRTDDSYPEGNWYHLRWWLDGVLQGDFPEMPMWGGPEFWYWEIAPTWGGNQGAIKTKEDYMLITRVATWVG